MRLRVVKSFHDKAEGVVRNVGDVFDVADKRGQEILAHPLNAVEVVDDWKKSKKDKK